MNSLVESFILSGTIVQNNTDDVDDTYNSLVFWFVFIAFVFYILAIYWAFQGYKEFKAILQNLGPNFGA